MALETKLAQKLSQQLLMTPQLQQAIKLLQLGRLDYIAALEKEILENPTLEVIDDDSSDRGNDSSDQSSDNSDENEYSTPNAENTKEISPSEENSLDWKDLAEHFSDYQASSSNNSTPGKELPSIEATLSQEQNLSDYIREQLRLVDVPEHLSKVIEYIIGSLGRYGYLEATDEEIVTNCNCTQKEVDDVLSLFKTLDPPGIGARDLGECLYIQLQHQGLENNLEGRIISQHLDKLEKRAFDKIAKLEKVAVEEVFEAIKAIQRLEPRPGRDFADETPQYIIPDIYVRKVDGEYVVALNEDGLPKLRVSSYYQKLLNGKKEEKNYLNERIKAASWLIKSIHQRQRTIYRVTESIVQYQREFFDTGIANLRPMVLKDVAKDIGMHESTVSRVTTNKYVDTPHGVFELKFFFSSAISGGEDTVSSSSVKNRIKDIIACEPPEKPISDQTIVEMLKEEDIKLARRTVAKYRESMGILSSSKRKKLF